MEEASLHTTRKHLFIFTQYYDKHGVPPTKRLFKVSMLDPSAEFIRHWGMSGDPGLPIVIRYHPGKANVVADALSRKERLKPRRVRAMEVTIQAGMRETIQAAQSEALKQPAWPRSADGKERG
ncbi:hypothetical protein Tco_1119065 [Tanacetum coccineum]